MLKRHRTTWPEQGSRDGLRRAPAGSPPGEGFPAPEWIRGGVLYCLFPRAFTPEGTLEAARLRLPEIKALGADAVWLLPIHPIGAAHRKGSVGSPYAIRDYRAVHSDLGTEADLRRFVDDAHGLGLRVIIDLVINHAAWDHPLAEREPGVFVRDGLGRPTRRVAGWQDVVDWNYEHPAVAEYLLDAITHWVRDVGIDGYRCDVAGMVPRWFWARVRERLLTLKPDHYLLAEWDDPELHRVAFHSTYDWGLFRRMKALARRRFPAARLPHLMAAYHAGFPAGAEPLRFVENHDEGPSTRRFRALCAALNVFVALSGGIWLIHNGQEVGARHRPSLFERDPIDWRRPGADAALRFQRGLARLHQFFRGYGVPEPLELGAGADLAGYRRRGPGGERLLVLMNAGRRPAPLPPTVAAEIRDAGLVGLSRARMAPGQADVIPPRAALVFAPPSAAESLA